MNKSDEPRWLAGLARLLDGEPEPGDGEMVADAMRQDPAVCREVSGLFAVDALLWQNTELSAENFVEAFAERIADRKDDDFARQVRSALPGGAGVWRRNRWWMAAAAAVVALSAVLAIQFAGRSPDEMATLLLAEGCEWVQDSPLQEGQRLVAGPLGLRQGLAVVRFDGGAELILRGDTKVELESAGQARLMHGNVTVRAPEDAAGFRLMTPAGEVVDLGTEFAALVESTGATELHVIEGEIAVTPARPYGQRAEVLHAGKAVRFDHGQVATHREVQMRADSFEAIVRAARPVSRAELMFAYEGFFYPPGRIPFAQGDGGIGWRGPWRAATKNEAYRASEDAVTDLGIAQGEASIPWPMPEGKPGMLEIPAGTRSLVRSFARPIALDKDAVTYFSFMVHEADVAPEPAPREVGGVRLVFRSSGDQAGELVSFGPSRLRRPGIRIGDGHNFTSPVQIARNQNTLWIGKIIARRNGDDEFFFSVYGEGDTFGFAEPATWQVASRGIRRQGQFDVVVIATQLSAPCAVDELRVGPTWRSIAPMQELTQAP